MKRLNLIIFVFLLSVLFNLNSISIVRAQTSQMGADYLVEIGKGYYEDGNMEEAMHEFSKALMIQANHKEAREYLNAALEERSEEVFMLALRNVAEAQGVQSLSTVSSEDEVAPPLHSDDSGSHLSRLSSLLEMLGFRLAVEARGAVSA